MNSILWIWDRTFRIPEILRLLLKDIEIVRRINLPYRDRNICKCANSCIEATVWGESTPSLGACINQSKRIERLLRKRIAPPFWNPTRPIRSPSFLVLRLRTANTVILLLQILPSRQWYQSHRCSYEFALFAVYGLVPAVKSSSEFAAYYSCFPL